MKKILGVQFRSDETALEQERECVRKQLQNIAEIDFVNSLDESIVWSNPQDLVKNYHGVILGGSGEFDFDGGRSENDPNRKISYKILERLTPFLDTVFTRDMPTFAICYGHQLVGAYAGVVIKNDKKQKKTGTFSVYKKADLSEDPLFAFFPDEALAQYGHKDVLTSVPYGAELLLSCGEQCKVSALRYKKNIYTTQFHPELTATDMLARLKNSPDYLPEGVMAEDLIQDDRRVNELLANFADAVVAI